VTLAQPLDAVGAALAAHFGHVPIRASVSFVGVDPIEVLRFEPVPDERAYLSLGMSRHPMTAPSAVTVSHDGPRAELMLHLRDATDVHADVWRSLALLAAAPAVEGVVYVDGMTVELGRPLSNAGTRCVGGLVVVAPIEPVGTDVGTVEFLQVLPATANELAWSRVHGSAALRQRWADQGLDLLDLTRAAARLD
jgi:hypothetical protein